jgi:DNA-binding IclR family transcriptional regulator
LEGAFSLLDVLAQRPGAGVSSLAAAARLPKATVYRLLEQLCAVGMVERHAGRYQVGYRAFELGRFWHPYPGLHAALRGPTRALARASGASVAGCVVRGGRTLIVGCAPGWQGPTGPLETSYPWPTAAGKVIVAFSRIEASSPQLPPAQWHREAAVIRERQAAVDDEAVVPGIRCLAVPIRGADGEVVAALAAMVVSSARTAGLLEGLYRAAKDVSATLRAELTIARDKTVRSAEQTTTHGQWHGDSCEA